MYDTSNMEPLDGDFFLGGDRRVYNRHGMPLCEMPRRIRNHHKWWGRVRRNRRPIRGAFLRAECYDLFFDCVKDLNLGLPIREGGCHEFYLGGRRLLDGDVIEIRHFISMPHDPMGHCRGAWHKATVSGAFLRSETFPDWDRDCMGERCHLRSRGVCQWPHKPRTHGECISRERCHLIWSLTGIAFCRWPQGGYENG